MDEDTKSKQLEKLAFLEAQKEFYTKNEKLINSYLNYRVPVFRKFNNSGKMSRKVTAASVGALASSGDPPSESPPPPGNPGGAPAPSPSGSKAPSESSPSPPLPNLAA